MPTILRHCRAAFFISTTRAYKKGLQGATIILCTVAAVAIL